MCSPVRFEVDFDITLQCMYACRHCNVDAGQLLEDEMTTAEIKHALDQLEIIGVCGLSITGGEPLAIKFFPYGAGWRFRDDLELSYSVWRDFLVELTAKKSKDPYYQGIEVSITCPWEIYVPLLNEGLPLEFINQTWDYDSPLQSELYRRGRNVGCHAGYISMCRFPTHAIQGREPSGKTLDGTLARL